MIILYFMENLHLYNFSKVSNFHQNRFINENTTKKKLESLSQYSFLVRYRRNYVLNKYKKTFSTITDPRVSYQKFKVKVCYRFCEITNSVRRGFSITKSQELRMTEIILYLTWNKYFHVKAIKYLLFVSN